MKLLSNWRAVLRHAWSVRLMILAALFSGAEIAWPFLEGFVPVPRATFGVISGLLTMAALIARFVAQKPISGE